GGRVAPGSAGGGAGRSPHGPGRPARRPVRGPRGPRVRHHHGRGYVVSPASVVVVVDLAVILALGAWVCLDQAASRPVGQHRDEDRGVVSEETLPLVIGGRS